MKRVVLSHLQSEHRCLLGHAERIQHQLNQIREGSVPDYVLLADRVRFLKDHYASVHAPKDGELVARLAKGSGNLENILTPFLNAHGWAFLEHLEAFEAGLQAVLCEHPVARERLLHHGNAALRHLREQIATEESATFPWARSRLEESDWVDIAASGRRPSAGLAGAGCEAVEAPFTRPGTSHP